MKGQDDEAAEPLVRGHLEWTPPAILPVKGVNVTLTVHGIHDTRTWAHRPGVVKSPQAS